MKQTITVEIDVKNDDEYAAALARIGRSHPSVTYIRFDGVTPRLEEQIRKRGYRGPVTKRTVSGVLEEFS